MRRMTTRRSKRPNMFDLATRVLELGRGFTLVHFSAQLERILWEEGCA